MTSLEAEKTALCECGKPKVRRIDRERILRLYKDHGWSQTDIADICKCSTATVREVWKAAGLATDRKIRTIGNL